MEWEKSKEVFKKVKIITGATQQEVDLKATQFEKDHEIMEIKQKSPTLMFIFYLEE